MGWFRMRYRITPTTPITPAAGALTNNTGELESGENPKQGMPSARRKRLSVPAGKISGRWVADRWVVGRWVAGRWWIGGWVSGVAGGGLVNLS